nr:amidohydrolase family protein [endosymbiont 'TC1' of Trimyema compressum]
MVFPGLINTHNHLYQVLLKGLGDDMVLKDWLEFMTFPSSPFLTEENCYYAALNGLAEGVHSGVTLLTFDYMYPHAKGIHDLDEGVLAAMKDLKIRGVLGRRYMDTGIEFGVHPSMIEKPDDIKASVRRLYRDYHGSESGRITIGMVPAELWSNSDASLKMTQKVSEDLDILVSIHVSETPFDK